MSERTIRQRLAEPFPPDAIQTFVGRGGRRFDYVEDESVMDRLDDVFGPGGWECDVVPFPNTPEPFAIVSITVTWPDGHSTRYADIGYPTQAGEPMKEAFTDGFRRVGRIAGIARDLYRKHPTQEPAPRATPTPRASTPYTPAVASNETQPPPVQGWSAEEMDAVVGAAEAAFDVKPIGPDPDNYQRCTEHNAEWRGTRTPMDLYHRKADGKYCRHPRNEPKERR